MIDELKKLDPNCLSTAISGFANFCGSTTNISVIKCDECSIVIIYNEETK